MRRLQRVGVAEIMRDRHVLLRGRRSPDRPGLGAEEPGKETEQARLSRAVRPDHGERGPRLHAKGNAGEDHAAAARAAEIVRFKNKRGESFGRHRENVSPRSFERFQSLASAYKIHYIRGNPARQALLPAGCSGDLT